MYVKMSVPQRRLGGSSASTALQSRWEGRSHGEERRKRGMQVGAELPPRELTSHCIQERSEIQGAPQPTMLETHRLKLRLCANNKLFGSGSVQHLKLVRPLKPTVTHPNKYDKAQPRRYQLQRSKLQSRYQDSGLFSACCTPRMGSSSEWQKKNKSTLGCTVLCTTHHSPKSTPDLTITSECTLYFVRDNSHLNQSYILW